MSRTNLPKRKKQIQPGQPTQQKGKSARRQSMKLMFQILRQDTKVQATDILKQSFSLFNFKFYFIQFDWQRLAFYQIYKIETSLLDIITIV